MAALLNQFEFDWFQITLPASDGGGTIPEGETEEPALNHALAWCELMQLHFGKIGGGANGYRAALPLHNGPEGEVVAKLACGSTTRVMPNLTITGGEGVCAKLAPAAQEYFKGARLSRADVRFDWSQEGFWDALLSMTRRLAASNPKMGGVRIIESEGGRTFYLGSTTSTVMLRVYEKDKERVATGKLDLSECDPHLVRVEFVFKPQSRSKAGFAKLTPAEMLRSSVWAREWLVRMAQMMNAVGKHVKLSKTRVEREERTTDLEASAIHGATQFGGVFSRLAISRLTAERFEGSYADAVFTRDEIEAKAAMLFFEMLQVTDGAERAMEREGVHAPEPIRIRRARIVHDMTAAASAHAEQAAEAEALIGGVVAAAANARAEMSRKPPALLEGPVAA